jgi:hypothetical protein
VTAIHPDALLAAMPNLDAQVACEWDYDCPHPATWRVCAHGVRSDDESCADHRLLLCNVHLNQLRQTAGEDLPYLCAQCGLIICQVSDVIRSVVAL